MKAASRYELDFWGDCANTLHEEQKQLVYAPRMGLLANWKGARPPTFDLMRRSVVDIGGGPVSLLLKCHNFARAAVVDPAPYPAWVKARYKAHGVKLVQVEGEDFTPKDRFDEAWIYNVLQHVRDPQRVIEHAYAAAPIIRLFEWIDVPAYDGHPQILSSEKLGSWLGNAGFTVSLNENGAVGKAFYGVFGNRSSS